MEKENRQIDKWIDRDRAEHRIERERDNTEREQSKLRTCVLVDFY